MKNNKTSGLTPVLNQTEAKSQSPTTGLRSQTSGPHGKPAGSRSKISRRFAAASVLCSLLSALWISCEPAVDVLAALKVDKSGLLETIEGAKDAKKDVATSADGSNVSANRLWVTEYAMGTLEAAIGEAEEVVANTAATQAEVNYEKTTLLAATGTFKDARNIGTKAGETSGSIDLDVTEPYTFPAAITGYEAGARTYKVVTITNNGGTATGALTIALSGSNEGSFELSKSSISDIAAGSNDTFTVAPNTGLEAATYTATVTVSGGGDIGEESFDVRFTVSSEAIYAIGLDTSETHTFTGATAGYNALSPKVVTVTNNGNTATGALTIGLSGSNGGSFKLSKTDISDIEAGGNDTFTVVPNDGLEAATYTATVTVSGGHGISESFNVGFTVEAAEEEEAVEAGPLNWADVYVETYAELKTAMTATAAGDLPDTPKNSGALTIGITADIDFTGDDLYISKFIELNADTITGLKNKTIILTDNGAGKVLKRKTASGSEMFIVGAVTSTAVDANQKVTLVITGKLEIQGWGVEAAENTSTASSIVTVYGKGVFELKGSAKLTKNYVVTSVASGAGVYVAANGIFNMSGGEISYNKNTTGVVIGAGGVYILSKGTFAMSGGSIHHNTRSESVGAPVGGGVFQAGGAGSTASFIMTGGEIYSNTLETTQAGGTPKGGGVGTNGTLGTITKTNGGTIYGCDDTNDKANILKVNGVTLDASTKPGIAIYGGTVNTKVLDITAGPGRNLSKATAGTSGGWDYDQ